MRDEDQKALTHHSSCLSVMEQQQDKKGITQHISNLG